MKKRGYLNINKEKSFLAGLISQDIRLDELHREENNAKQSNQPYSLMLRVIELSRVMRRRDEDLFVADISD